MKIIGRLILLFSALTLANCAPAGSKNSNPSMLGTTGYSRPDDGTDYVTNGDERVQEALREPETTPAPAAPGAPAAPAKPAGPVLRGSAQKVLRERLKEFEISRYFSGDTAVSRFGDARVSIRIIFIDGKKTAEFKAELTGTKPKYFIKAENGGYTLTGELNDTEHQSRGEFVLTETATKDNARIFFWAYKAKLRVRENRLHQTVAGSELEKQILDLRTNTFGWVNNWSVVRGISFFLVDIVKLVPQSGAPATGSVLAFKGPSLRTGDASHDVDEIGGTPSTIQLVGNAEEGAGRIFQVTMQDPKTKQNNEFMLDVELEKDPNPPVTGPQTPDEVVEEPEVEQPVAPPAPPAPRPQTPPVAPAPGQQPPPAPAPAPAPPQEPVRVGKSYLRISSSLPRTTKMTNDFNRNRNLSGVKQWMETYKGNWKGSLQKFYTYANPFRRLMEKVGQAFDVSPAYAYLTVIESAYFTGGQYKIQGSGEGSTALGPFQLLVGTAREVGLMVGGPADERRYFVPSACGAAKYIRKLVDKFDDSDSTVAILAYFQGDGGAAAAIYCSFDPNAGNRQECASRINKTFSGTDYNRFLRLTKNYNYSYAEMDRMAAIPGRMRDYVNKKLAIYFISNDFSKHGFRDDGQTDLPRNETVMPTRSLKDRECQGAVQGIL